MATIKVIAGDITRLAVDAIVNAANSSLMGGSGVDGAIHRSGGPEILEACRKIVAKQGLCKTGEAVITPAGNLPAKYVIHTVGPVWNGGRNNEAEKLANCYRNSLLVAANYPIRTIAFPNISTGIYGYPKKDAAAVAFNTVIALTSNETPVSTVYFVCFDTENFQLYTELNKNNYPAGS